MDPLLHFNGPVCAPGPEGSNPVTAVNRDIAGSRFQTPAQNFQERRLVATVRSDQTISVTPAEFDGNILKQWLGTRIAG